MLSNLLSFRLLLTVVCGIPIAGVTAQDVAWAWVNPSGQGATFTPSGSYQFNTRGGTITVDRDPVQQNRFLVKVPNMPAYGAVHVTAYNGNHVATVYNWLHSGTSMHAYVALFDNLGGPANDAPFSFHYRVGGNQSRHEAYLWADQPTAASYTVNTGTSFVSAGGTPTVQRLGGGHYRVTVPGLANTSAEIGNVQVTPQSSSLLHARISYWMHVGGDLRVEVICADQAGAPADGRFFLSYQERAAAIDEADGTGAHLLALFPTVAAYDPPAIHADSNGTQGPRNHESILRQGVGRYRVHLPSVAPVARSNAQVTPYGQTFSHATVRSWTSDGRSGTYVYVDTYDASGTPTDAAFSLSYLTNRPNQEAAWAWVSNPNLAPGATFTPNASYQYTASGEDITVQRSAASPNQFVVTVPDTGPYDGIAHVTPYGGNHIAMVRGWNRTGDDTRFTIELFTAAGNPAPSLLPFTFLYLRSADPNAQLAWRVCNNLTAPTNPPPPQYGWNGNRGAPTVTPAGVNGWYRVFIPGLQPSGGENGHLQVTPAGFQGPLLAEITNPVSVGGGLQFDVVLWNLNGVPTNGWFIVSYHKGAVPMPERMGSGTHLWADNPSPIAGYAPNPSYHESNGTLGPQNAEVITRVAVGTYEVTMPNVAEWLSSTLLVSIRRPSVSASSPAHATIGSWTSAPGGGTRALVRTFDANGVLRDAPFSLLYMTNRPAIGTPATNSSIGSGCHGALLTPLTRPVLGTDWDLRLASLPAGTMLAVIVLGLTNPNTALGAQAPGCWQFSSASTSVTVPLPAPNPAYSLALPQDPSMIGLPLFAQSAAFVPNLNPLWLATSNGVLGLVGDS
ncbi:MAG: hypothetical protein U1E73_10460 [Planctomycetota bacterium]